ncbi:MAG: hypothetical protein Q4B48_06810 [Syntrophomonadaceae bacterium]|nr:hypothetical protein [Syntrophomonadaceae bacterium]
MSELKNLKYFPFERNRYFYGKLLTVDDFETEQKYMNDKRRMINRFLMGTGVVCGMNVVRVDDTTISVEMGMALDFSGREIVIEAPMIKRLSMIEGFDSNFDENSNYMYLCLEYAEKEKEPVHSITSTNVRRADEVEHNKYMENYRLFLTSQEPENEGFTIANFYQDTKTVYWGNGLRIKQTIPRYIQTGDTFEMTVVVENMGQQQPISFDYDLILTCVQNKGQHHLRVHFDEKEHAKAGRYQLRYELDAMSVVDTQGVVAVQPDSFVLTIGEREVSARAQCENVTDIIAGNAKRELMKRYYNGAMEDIVKNTFQQSIYLAKIAVIRAASTYVIENIETMPFKQFVFNNSLAAALNDIEIDEMERLQISGGAGFSTGGANISSVDDPAKGIQIIATGSVVLDLGIGGAAGQCFYSETITHGLGLGPVHISLAQAQSVSEDSDLFYGSPDIFRPDDQVPQVSLAARVNVKSGTFQIGAKMLAASSVRRLKVNWTALRDPKESMKEVVMRRIFVKPDVANIEVRETCYFEAAFVNMPETLIKWSVKEENGGSINANGMYTAPNIPGVYEIIAESTNTPPVKASTYVVVRDSKPEEA